MSAEREIRRARARDWYWKNKKRAQERHKKWYQKNKNKIQTIKYKDLSKDRKQQILENKKSYRRNHKRELSQYTAKYNAKLKIEVLKHYSNGTLTCAFCGFSNIHALSIDHVESDGARHRREIPNLRLYWWLRKNNFPKGFQVLCMNCQFIKRINRREYRKEPVSQPLQLQLLFDEKKESKFL